MSRGHFEKKCQNNVRTRDIIKTKYFVATQTRLVNQHFLLISPCILFRIFLVISKKKQQKRQKRFLKKRIYFIRFIFQPFFLSAAGKRRANVGSESSTLGHSRCSRGLAELVDNIFGFSKVDSIKSSSQFHFHILNHSPDV